MFCDSCGASLETGHVFCPKCGKHIGAVAAVAPRPAVNRVAQHGQLLGILWIVYSTLVSLTGVIILVVFTHILPNILRYQPRPPQGPPPEVVIGMLRPIMHFIAMLVLAKGLAGILAGIGILQRAGFARVLTLVVACISLLSVPFGTAIGVYSLWVLLSPGAEDEFHHA